MIRTKKRDMASTPSENITRLLLDWSGGNEAALGALLPLVYAELRIMAQRQMRRERSAHTLQRTALVHEAFLRLVDQRSVNWQSRAHFFSLASKMMRRILLDHARRRGSAKRGAHAVALNIDEVLRADDTAESQLDGALSTAETSIGLMEVDDALQHLERVDPRQGKLVELRFFGGLSLEEAAAIIGVSTATAKRDWVFARAWLQRQLGEARSSS
jgi:RNA polymerase sigma factor (TIGR02999 family)